MAQKSPLGAGLTQEMKMIEATSVGCSEEAGTPESVAAQESPGWPEAAPLWRGRALPQDVELPPTVRDSQAET